MDILRSQFAKYDSANKGTVSVNEFKASMEKFGIREGLQPVIKKFSTGGGVDYNSFITHFQSRQGRSDARPQEPQRGPAHDTPTRRRSNSAGPTVGAVTKRPSVIGKPQGYEHSQQRYERIHEQETPRQRDDRPSFVLDTPSHDAQERPKADDQMRELPPFVEHTSTVTSYSRPYEGLDVYKGNALDVHRSDSGSIAAFALGEITEGRVDAWGRSHVGKRRRGSPVTRAHESTLPVASLSCLNGFDENSVNVTRGQRQELKRRGRGTSASRCSPQRCYDLISGVERQDGERDNHRVEGKRYIPEARGQSPHRTVGVRTYGDSQRPFKESEDKPKGLRTQIVGRSSDSLADGLASAQNSPRMPRGPYESPTTASSIPGLSACVPAEAERVRRKGRTKEPSSFGYQPTPSDFRSVSPGFRAASPRLLRGQVASRVNTNSPTLARAWTELLKTVGGDGKGLTPEKFAEAMHIKYSIAMNSNDARALTNKESIQFTDFTQLCKGESDSGTVLNKIPDRPDRATGRRYHSHDRESVAATPPFATSTSSACVTPQRHRISLGPADRVQKVMSAPVDTDHYITTNMRTYSPIRSRSPVVHGPLAAGFPNRLRDESTRRKRCFSPGFTNRESAGNPITHQ